MANDLSDILDSRIQELKKETAVTSRRQHLRFEFVRNVDWDFFTARTGAKPAWISNVSNGGCLLHAEEPIEHRRWIRMVVRENDGNVWFIATGRTVWREDKIDAWNATGAGAALDEANITLHRYGIEFVHSMNPVVMTQIRQTARENSPLCKNCGEKVATVPDQDNGERLLCVLCHLRSACQHLLSQEGLEGA